MSAKKILLISEIFPPINGGSGRWFWELYSRLPANEFCVLAGESVHADEFDKTHHMQVHRFNMSIKQWADWGILNWTGIKFYWRLIRKILHLVESENIGAIHCGRCIPEGVAAYIVAKLKGIPYLCFVHGEDVTNAARSREFTWMVNKALKSSSKLICNSQNSKNVLMKDWGCPESQIEVLNPGVDTNKFIPAEYNREIRNKFNWQDRPVILTVSRLEERKGHDMLIRALDIVKAHHPDVLYAIIGGGDRRTYLEDLVESLKLSDHVMFMSELSDEQMIECYQQCDIFALPNRTIGLNIEGFGMVLVEAQSCAKPVIGGNSGGTPETMIIGETGFVIDCTEPTKLATKLVELLNNRMNLPSIGQKGREHVVNTLDWQAHAQKAQVIFKSLNP
ncbi:glycosyltransferase family 4 protein [Catenovulum sp. 2E275]|uniref:glycosyltransferase family 4 protein n=1 Tax=Catenovulum sp. 2E275 TaxID=2980497 RepID=UPI0021D1FDC1|nr:glycosyltransferase family 4 protein [Catenovulum sp. 2E275]MCU4675553.1 glycosyltransferase family 4 protein [Catenovulum sp. 2E275]